MKKKKVAMIAMVFALVLLSSIVGFGCSSYDDIVSVNISNENLRVALEDVQDLKLNVNGVRQDGKLVRLAASDYTLDAQEITEPGKYPLTVTYKDITKTFTLNVVETKVVAVFSRTISTNTSDKDGITPEAPGTILFSYNEDYTDKTASNWDDAYEVDNRSNMRRIHEYANIKFRFYEKGKYVISYDYLGYRAGTLTNDETQVFDQVGERVTDNAILNKPVITGKYVTIDGYYSFKIGTSFAISTPVYQNYLHATILGTVTSATAISSTITLTNLSTFFHIDVNGNFVDTIRSDALAVKLVLDHAL